MKIADLVGLPQDSQAINDYLASLSSHPLSKEVKSYPDALYHNYYHLGLSLMFIPKTNKLDSIYIYNKHQNFAVFPALPLSLPANQFQLSSESTGKDLVSALGEPDRKGGGSGPSSGSISIWCEWLKFGLMVEFGGDNARGPKAWETGKDAVWKIVTVFSP